MTWLKLFAIFLWISAGKTTPTLPITPSRGGVVPLPQKIEQTEEFFVLRPTIFRFNATLYTCDTLDEALSRYWKLISKTFKTEKNKQNLRKSLIDNSNYLGKLTLINVELENPCNDKSYPHLYMNENYTININTTNRSIKASSLWGILRGLETFSQLIYRAYDNSRLLVNSTSIEDFPRFPHRGLLLDTSRHFIPLEYILKTLDAMSYNKLNVFHWHIVDDQSFPYKSSKFPGLSDKGAYHPVAAVYEPQDVRKVIDYARKRGIRVMAEFDTPGHTLSWGKGVENILTKCVGIADKYGPMDPSKANLYEFLTEFFREINEVFPDKYVHLGGDEVPFDCWQSNPNITEFMKSLNIQGHYEQLESYYIQKLIDIVSNNDLKSIVWEEVFNNKVNITNSTIVHVWKDEYRSVMDAATSAGKPVLLSSCWYLDHLGNWGDWLDYYNCDPYDFPGTNAQKDLVLGGEACMWSERVDAHNVIQRVWPRACAAAEKLWSSVSGRDMPIVNQSQIDSMRRRLEEHTCRMNARGIEAPPPNGPSYCA